MLVLEGAPLEQVAAAALWAAFAPAAAIPPRSAGSCACRRSAEPLLGALGRARRGACGSAIRGEPETEVGPLAPPMISRRSRRWSREAVAGGAELVCGGPTTVPGLSGAFYAPAVLRRVPPDARILREPAPGPVLAVVEAAARPPRSRRRAGRRAAAVRRAAGAARTAARAAASSASGPTTGRRASGSRASSAPS